jgi:ADP-ribose pyrophosphatase YjhB (NUDIX family)
MKKIRIACRGLIIHNEKVLLQNTNNREFWNVPGGGFESDDSSVTSCVVREVLEETGLETKVLKLLLVHEFQMENTEQIELFFALQAMDPKKYNEFHKDPDSPGVRNRLCWFSIGEVKKLNLKPDFLQSNLEKILSKDTDFFTQSLIG